MDPAQPAVRPGDLLASKYRVEKVLGQGGMGVVVAARHEQLGFRVALKFMLPAALHDAQMKDRFLREAQAAGRLRGEHVARIMDFGTLDDGAPYIVMEFLEGADLQDTLAARGPLPAPEAIEYLLQACKGMQEAHEQGIVHRDLKPQNLFLTQRPDGSPLVKVLDFGISKLVETEAQSLSMTASSAIMGSPLYMSPEQLRSSKNVDARADIYSLGVILYQLLSGTLPIEATSLGELFEHVLTRPIPALSARLPGVHPELDAIVMRCLAREPAARFASVGELAAALAPLQRAMRGDPGYGPRQGTLMAPGTHVAPHGPITTLGSAAASASTNPIVHQGSRALAWAGAAIGAAVLVTAAVAMRKPPDAVASAASAPAAAPSAASPSAPAPPEPAVAPVPSASAPALPMAALALAPPETAPSGPTSARPAASNAPAAASSAHAAPARTPTKVPAASATPPPVRPTPKSPSADPFSSPD